MDWLKKERRRRKLSQRALARKAGVAYKTVQLIESGRHDPRWSTLAKLAHAVGADARVAENPRTAGEGALSLAAASARILAEGEASWRLWLLEFVDGFRRRPDPALAARAPEPGLSHRLQALLASTVESLCAEARQPPPWWCAGVPPLPAPWFVAGLESLKASALVESPAQFRRRNIFVLGNFLSRA